MIGSWGWVVVGRGWRMIWGRRRMVRCRRVIRRRCVVTWRRFMISWFFRRRIGFGISRTTVADGGTGMIACSYIFIEDCSIGAVEGVLFTMRMTQMVDLKTK